MQQTSAPQLRRAGTELINGSPVPVFLLPNGQRFAEVADFLSDQPNLISLSAAKQFKVGQYPIKGTFSDSIRETPESPAPSFMTLSDAQQDAAAQALLTRMFERIDHSTANFNYMEN